MKNTRLLTLALAATLAATLGLDAQGGPPQGGAQQGQAGQGRGGPGGRGQQPARDAQTQPTVGTSAISGTVVVEGTGSAVRRARVNLSGAELRGGRSAITNDEGQFSFTALPAGRYTMTAAKAGYVDISYGAKRAGRPGTPIQLAEGQKFEKATISLPRGSVVTGVVIDEHSEPSPGTQIRVMRYVLRTGEKTLQQAGQDQTDDRGIYRIYGLQPGEYVVSAVPRNLNIGDLRQTMMAELESLMQQAQAAGAARGAAGGGGGGGGGRGGRGAEFGGLGAVLGGRGEALIDRATELQQRIQQQEQEQTVAYAPVYYPGTTTPSTASTVTLGVGEERAGVDFQLQLVPTARIEGAIQSPDGTVPQGVQISLVPADQVGTPAIPGLGLNMARANQEGRFSFTNVTPGQYRIMARATLRQTDPNAPQVPGGRGGVGPGGGRGGPGQITQVLWAATDVSVGGQNISNLILTLQQGMTVTGRVTFEGSALVPPADLTRVRINLAPRGQQAGFEVSGVPPAQVDASGRFTITGVVPGRYTVSANVPAGGGGQAPQAPQTTTSAGRGGTGQPVGNWVMKSALAVGRDVLDFPLVIEPNQDVSGVLLTLVDRTQEVTGTIQNATGQPTADYSIIIFPSDNRYWLPQSRRIMQVRPGTDGKFTFRGLPPGEYRLTAVTDVEPGEWFNPDFLSQLVPASIAISVAEGGRVVQDIRLRQ